MPRRAALLSLIAFVVAACDREATHLTATAASASAVGLAAEPAYVIDFESFSAGAIHGQFDWKSTGGLGAVSPPLSHCAVYDHVITDNGAASPNFGSRSLRISNAVTSGCYADHTFSARAADVAGQTGAVSLSRDGLTEYALPGAQLRSRFDASWTFISTTPASQQAGLEVVASPARGDDHRMSWIRMADLGDGIAISFAQRAEPSSPGAFQIATIASGLDRTVSHTIRITMDLVDGPTNDLVRVYVDGQLLHTGTSWEVFYALDPNGSLNFAGKPPAVNRLMFRTGSDLLRGVPGVAAPALLGLGFLFDDVRVSVYSLPASANDCKKDGWRVLRNDAGEAFINQGDCVSAVQHVSYVKPDASVAHFKEVTSA